MGIVLSSKEAMHDALLLSPALTLQELESYSSF